MAFAVSAISELDTTVVDQARAAVKQLLSEQQSSVNALRGPVADLVIEAEAILRAAETTMATRLQDSSSIAAIQANPSLADDTLVDKVASNYRVTRQAAAAAHGEVTIVLNALTPVNIAKGAVFTVRGLTFTADSTFSAKTASGLVLLTTDRLLTAAGTGQYAFTVTVTAAATGPASNLAKDTLLTLAAAPTSFVMAYATADFTGGQNAQSNTDLIPQLTTGMAARCFSSPATLLNLLRTADQAVYSMVTGDFAKIVATAVIGAGRAEMQRDRHWIFPVSGGGRTDVYLLSRTGYSYCACTKTATLVQKSGTIGYWQVDIGYNDAPGFYAVTNIRKTGAAVGPNYSVTSETCSLDTAVSDYLPDILYAAEAGYSRYQTVTVKFLDTDTVTTSLNLGATQSYDLTFWAMPLIRETQEFLGHPDILDPGGDVLVRGAIPCRVLLSLQVALPTGATLDTAAVANAACTYVNSLGFAGNLYASTLLAAIQSTLPAGAQFHSVAMTGVIQAPNTTTYNLASSSVLTIPSHPTASVGPATVAFFLKAADVLITT